MSEKIVVWLGPDAHHLSSQIKADADVVLVVDPATLTAGCVKHRTALAGAEVKVYSAGNGFAEGTLVTHAAQAEAYRTQLHECVAVRQEIGEERDRLRDELTELRFHSRSLVELLRDAWWVKAAQHFKEMAALVARRDDHA